MEISQKAVLKADQYFLMLPKTGSPALLPDVLEPQAGKGQK